MDFSQKVVIVTGGANGIGFCCTKELLQQGVKAAVIADICVDSGNKAVDELEKEFGPDKVLFLKTDVTDIPQFEALFKKTIEVFGNVDILINNAGVNNEQNWSNVIAVNLLGTTNGVVLGFENYIRNHKSGAEGIIVNIASVGGVAPYECFPIYTATKHGVVGLTRSFGTANHYNRTHIKILALCPGPTNTPLMNAVPSEVMLNEEYVSLLVPPKVVQCPEEVASALIYAIKFGKTGSLWVIEEGKCFELFLPRVDSIQYQ